MDKFRHAKITPVENTSLESDVAVDRTAKHTFLKIAPNKGSANDLRIAILHWMMKFAPREVPICDEEICYGKGETNCLPFSKRGGNLSARSDLLSSTISWIGYGT